MKFMLVDKRNSASKILHFKLCIGAAEQDKITEIRLHKLIQEDCMDGAPQSKL